MGGAAALIGGVEVSATVTRENNELVVKVGPIVARIWVVARSGGKVPLDADGRLRLMPGDSQSGVIEGFDAGSPVEVRLYSDPVLLGRSQVGGSGLLSASYEIPADVTDGDHTVVLVGESPESEELVVAWSVAIGEPEDGASWFTIFVLVPLGLAAASALILPAVLRRRRQEQAA